MLRVLCSFMPVSQTVDFVGCMEFTLLEFSISLNFAAQSIKAFTNTTWQLLWRKHPLLSAHNPTSNWQWKHQRWMKLCLMFSCSARQKRWRLRFFACWTVFSWFLWCLEMFYWFYRPVRTKMVVEIQRSCFLFIE